MQRVGAELAAAVGDLQHARASYMRSEMRQGAPLSQPVPGHWCVRPGRVACNTFHLQLLISRPMHAGLYIFTE